MHVDRHCASIRVTIVVGKQHGSPLSMSRSEPLSGGFVGGSGCAVSTAPIGNYGWEAVSGHYNIADIKLVATSRPIVIMGANAAMTRKSPLQSYLKSTPRVTM